MRTTGVEKRVHAAGLACRLPPAAAAAARGRAKVVCHARPDLLAALRIQRLHLCHAAGEAGKVGGTLAPRPLQLLEKVMGAGAGRVRHLRLFAAAQQQPARLAVDGCQFKAPQTCPQLAVTPSPRPLHTNSKLITPTCRLRALTRSYSRRAASSAASSPATSFCRAATFRCLAASPPTLG